MSTSESSVRSKIAKIIDEELKALDDERATLIKMKQIGESAIPVVAAKKANGKGPFTGFRDALRRALKNRPNGLTGKEITDALRESGDLDKYQGAVAPSVRVHNELYSLGKKGEVVRDKKEGRYRLKDARQ